MCKQKLIEKKEEMKKKIGASHQWKFSRKTRDEHEKNETYFPNSFSFMDLQLSQIVKSALGDKPNQSGIKNKTRFSSKCLEF